MRLQRIALAVAALALPLVACGEDKQAKVLSGYQLTPAPVVGTMTLPDASNDGEPFPFVADEGDYLIVYFGYTSCPDVCPTTLSEVKKALKQIGDDAEQVDVAMITIDPTRDTGELLTNYVQTFVPDSHALRTEDDTELQAVAKGFGASYTVTENEAGEIEVSHSGNLYVVDDQGDVVLQWPFGLEAPAIATDLEILFGKG